MGHFWESEKLYLDGDLYFNDLLNDIENAVSYITVEMYIFNYDLIGQKITEALIKAGQRGVKVQIIVDGVGTYNYFSHLHPLFSAAKIPVKIFHPLPFYHPFYGKLILSKKIRALLARLWRLNQRNHRKIITIDENIMFLGSFNLTQEHTSLSNEIKWKDVGVRITGPNVKLGILYFKKIWQLRDFFKYRKNVRQPKLKEAKYFPLRLNHSIVLRRIYQKNLHQRIQKAKDTIWLATPYFIPSRKFIMLLAKAAERGVDVRVLISSKTDVKIFQTLQFFYYPYLIKKNVKIFHYKETVLHAKIFIIDDWVTVGSSNLNHRSLLHDLEADLAIQEKVNKEIIKKDFQEATHPEHLVTIDDLKKRPLLDKILSRIFFLFKYWF
jgi:cardiolipin synthase